MTKYNDFNLYLNHFIHPEYLPAEGRGGLNQTSNLLDQIQHYKSTCGVKKDYLCKRYVKKKQKKSSPGHIQ